MRELQSDLLAAVSPSLDDNYKYTASLGLASLTSEVTKTPEMDMAGITSDTIDYPNGDRYEGQVKHEQRHGKGLC